MSLKSKFSFSFTSTFSTAALFLMFIHFCYVFVHHKLHLLSHHCIYIYIYIYIYSSIFSSYLFCYPLVSILFKRFCPSVQCRRFYLSGPHSHCETEWSYSYTIDVYPDWCDSHGYWEPNFIDSIPTFLYSATNGRAAIGINRGLICLKSVLQNMCISYI